MSLQDWFYVLGIFYFVTMWIVLIGIIVVLVMVANQVRQFRLRVENTVATLPFLGMVWPVIRSVNRWWRRNH